MLRIQQNDADLTGYPTSRITGASPTKVAKLFKNQGLKLHRALRNRLDFNRLRGKNNRLRFQIKNYKNEFSLKLCFIFRSQQF